MPEVTRFDHRRTPSTNIRGRKPTAGTWRELGLIHPRNLHPMKHHIISGLYARRGNVLPAPSDADFIGEMNDPERREKVDETRWRRGAIDAEVRGIPGKSRSVAARDQALVTASNFVEQFYGDLPRASSDPAWLVANHLAGLNVMQPLARARTTRRLYLLGRLPETLELRQRQEGRRNLGSTRTVLAAIADRLTAQIAFDAMTARSLERRSEVALAALSYDILQLLLIIDLMGHASEEVVRRRLPPILGSLCAKPALYPASYADWLLNVQRQPLDQGQTRALIAAACQAEIQLLSINAALSKLRDDRRLIDSPMLLTLRASVDAIGIDRHTGMPAYGDLALALQAGLTLLPAALEDPREPGIPSAARMIRGMKDVIRNRFSVPERPNDPIDHPWMLRTVRDDTGRPMWVAEARFGARSRR